MNTSRHNRLVCAVKRSCWIVLCCLVSVANAHPNHLPPPVYGAVEINDGSVDCTYEIRRDLLKAWTGFDDKQLDFTSKDAYEQLKQEIGPLIDQWAPVSIDDRKRTAVVHTLVMPESGVDHIQIGVTYELEAVPRRVSFIWLKYDDFDKFSQIDAAAGGGVVVQEFLGDTPINNEEHEPQVTNMVAMEFYVYGQRRNFVLTDTEPEFVWHNRNAPKPVVRIAAMDPAKAKVELPMVSIGVSFLLPIWFVWCMMRDVSGRTGILVGCAILATAIGVSGLVRREVKLPWMPAIEVPEPAEALFILESLQENIYSAFDYRSEEDIYNTLAQSVAGETLDDIYVNVYKSLIMQEHGGAVCQVTGVDVIESEMLPLETPDDMFFKIDCRWQVTGTVNHWGHAHERINEYQGRYTIENVDGYWKIAEIDMKSEKRVGGEPGTDGQAVEDYRTRRLRKRKEREAAAREAENE